MKTIRLMKRKPNADALRFLHWLYTQLNWVQIIHVSGTKEWGEWEREFAWWKCPLCRKGYGEHEENRGIVYGHDGFTGGQGTCPRCADEAKKRSDIFNASYIPVPIFVDEQGAPIPSKLISSYDGVDIIEKPDGSKWTISRDGICLPYQYSEREGCPWLAK